MLGKDPINITYGVLGQIFKVLNEKFISAKQIIPCLATLYKKRKILLQTFSKNHIILWKKLKSTLKIPNDLEKLHPYFPEEEKEEMSVGNLARSGLENWRKDCFVTASFPSFIKEGNNNSFPQIYLHDTNAFFEDLTSKHFYSLAYKLHFLHTDLPTLHKRCVFPHRFCHYWFI